MPNSRTKLKLRPFVYEKDLPGVKIGGSVWKRFKAKYPHISDDLYEEMVLAVMQANRNLAKIGGHPNPVGYIRLYVRGILTNYVSRIGCVSVCRTTYRKMKGQVKTQETLRTQANYNTDLRVLELKEVIYGCCSNNREILIVDLLLEGYSQTEMIDELAKEGIIIKTSRLGQLVEQYRSKLEKVLECQSRSRNGVKDLMKCRTDSPTLEQSLKPPMELLQSSPSNCMLAVSP